MQVTFDIELPPDEQVVMAGILGVEPNGLGLALAPHAKAATHEYVERYVGRHASMRGADILERRLALLSMYAFDGLIPTASQVADLFHITPERAGTLVRNAFARYRLALEKMTVAAIKRTLEEARWVGADEVNIQFAAPNLLGAINARLLSADAGYKQVRRTQRSVGTYSIAGDAYDALCVAVAAAPVAKP